MMAREAAVRAAESKRQNKRVELARVCLCVRCETARRQAIKDRI